MAQIRPRTKSPPDIYAVNGFNGVDLTQNAKTLQVAEAYDAMLDRAPEASGMKNAVAGLNGGGTLADLCNNMFLSPEFQQKLQSHHLTNSNTDVVNYLYGTFWAARRTLARFVIP